MAAIGRYLLYATTKAEGPVLRGYSPAVIFSETT